MELYRLSIAETRVLLDKKDISVHDVITSVYQRIGVVEDKVKAFVTLTKDRAGEMASAAQKKAETEKTVNKASLLGIPLAIKAGPWSASP